MRAASKSILCCGDTIRTGIDVHPHKSLASAVAHGAFDGQQVEYGGAGKTFVRVDIDPGSDRVAATQDAFRRRAHLITNATLVGAVEGVDAEADVDVLVRTDAGYLPVVISNHRVARAHPSAELEMIPTGRLGLGQPLTVHAKARHHTVDGYRVALAHLLLGERADGRAAVIGQDRTRAYLC